MTGFFIQAVTSQLFKSWSALWKVQAGPRISKSANFVEVDARKVKIGSYNASEQSRGLSAVSSEFISLIGNA